MLKPLKELRTRDPKSIYRRYDSGNLRNVAGLDLLVDEPYGSHLTLDFETQPDIWKSKESLVEYLISKLKWEKWISEKTLSLYVIVQVYEVASAFKYE